MNIPPKYEDVVANLDAALAREAELREELAELRESYESMRDRKNSIVDLQQRLTVAEQKLGDAYEWGYGDGQQSPNGYSDKEDRDKCVAELLKQAADCEHGYSNQTGCPVCQGIKP